jgi:hypothetical protein
MMAEIIHMSQDVFKILAGSGCGARVAMARLAAPQSVETRRQIED